VDPDVEHAPERQHGRRHGETTLAAAAAAGDTNIKLASVAGLVVGNQLKVDVDFSGGNQELVTITVVGTSGAAGTGVTFTPALTRAHVLAAPTASATAAQAGRTGGIGGVPLVQPPAPGSAPGTVCGRVVVPIQVNGLSYFSSSDCGAHWSASTQITPNMTATHTAAQGLRTSLLPSSSIDGSGAIYLTWQTRSFRVSSVASTPNDIAMAVMPAPTAANPYPAFGAPVRIPIEADNTTANTVDHFIPGISADPAPPGRPRISGSTTTATRWRRASTRTRAPRSSATSRSATSRRLTAGPPGAPRSTSPACR